MSESVWEINTHGNQRKKPKIKKKTKNNYLIGIPTLQSPNSAAHPIISFK